MKYKRILLLVLDGCGVGSQSDFNKYNPFPTNTIGNVYKNSLNLKLPFLESLGLKEILEKEKNSGNNTYAELNESSAGNDTFAGLWEMFGTIFKKRFISNLVKLEKTHLNLLKKGSINTICNEYISGFIALDKYFIEHKKTGFPILYLSDDGVILLAGHEKIIDPVSLNKIAEEISKCFFDLGFTRIVTRPFSGEPGAFFRLEDKRKDFLMTKLPRNNPLSFLVKNGLKVRTTNHISKIFNNPKGLSLVEKKYQNNQEIFDIIDNDTLGNKYDIQIYVIPDTDNLGHRKDIIGFSDALQYIDKRLYKLSQNLLETDLLMITADHGCDPTANIRGHCREAVPLFFYSKKINNRGFLGIKDNFAGIGQTIRYNFNLDSQLVGEKLDIF